MDDEQQVSQFDGVSDAESPRLTQGTDGTIYMLYRGDVDGLPQTAGPRSTTTCCAARCRRLLAPRRLLGSIRHRDFRGACPKNSATPTPVRSTRAPTIGSTSAIGARRPATTSRSGVAIRRALGGVP